MSKEIKNQESFDLPSELVRWENKKAEIQNQKGVVSRELKYLHDSQEQETAILKSIQDKIKKGEVSTKDKIEDFCLVYFPKEPEKAKQLHNLENQLRQHPGEFVLLKIIESEAHGHIFLSDGKPHPDLYHWEEKVQVGIISEGTPLNIDVKSGRIIIAPEKHSYINTWRGSKSFLENESISIPWWKFDQLGRSLESVYSNDYPSLQHSQPTEEQINSRGEKDIAMEILVDDDEVFKYFKNHSLLDLYPIVAKQLGRELKKLPVESEKAFNERKKGVFTNLQEAVEKERDLRNQLEQIKKTKASKIGDSIHFADIDQNTEDEIEDLKIIKSIPLNNEHKEILNEIKTSLKEALDLEMHQTPWIIKKDLDPGKVELNVPEIINSYIEYYNFPEIKNKLGKNQKT